ncbi:MAG: hypothetical protein AAF975_07355 [Spirochaetota bacterium]
MPEFLEVPYKILLFACVLFVSGGLAAQERGPISVFINGGGGALIGTGSIQSSGIKTGEIKDGKMESIKIGLGASYAHPINPLLGIGVFGELRVWINRLAGKASSTGGSTFAIYTDDKDALGFGVSFGPYFRLGLWGTDKKGGIGLAPYLTINLMRRNVVSNTPLTALNHEQKSLLGIGGGLFVDIFITKMFGVNLGLELQGSKLKLESTSAGFNWNGDVPFFGAIFYGGITVSF